MVLPPAVVAALDGLPSLDFAALVAALRERFPVELLEAPPEGRRVAVEDDVRLLEALTAPLGATGRQPGVGRERRRPRGR